MSLSGIRGDASLHMLDRDKAIMLNVLNGLILPQVDVLSEGFQVYFGAPQQASEWLSSLGYRPISAEFQIVSWFVLWQTLMQHVQTISNMPDQGHGSSCSGRNCNSLTVIQRCQT